MSEAGAGAPTTFEVFLSYARSQSRDEAEAARDALDTALGSGRTYLDTRDAPLDERFPDDIRRALLGSRVVVAFVGETYFRKWWCLKEWHLALSPYVWGRHPTRDAKAAALRHVVIALPAPNMAEAEWRLLPPDAQERTTVRAAEMAALVDLIRRRLAERTETLAQGLERIGVLAEVTEAFGSEEAIPPARATNRCRQYPISLPASLQKKFVGRADDLWRTHTLLVAGSAPAEFAPTSVAVRAFAGVGKTTIAREYLHRFGATHFRGGLFWIDASESGESLARQHHGIWKALDDSAPSFEAIEGELKDPRRVAAEIAKALERALHAIPAEERVLVVVESVPEERAGTTELAVWCPASEKVSLLATSRAGMPGVAERLDLDVLDPSSAIALLTRRAARGELQHAEWVRIVEWVGRLPQALVLLSEALGRSVLRPRELLGHASGTGALPALDAQVAALDGLVPEAARRGIAQAFALSCDLLPEAARRAAQRLAWFAPAPMPDVLVDAVLAGVEGAAVGRDRGVLSERSFIARDGSPPMWRMHRLLAEFLRRDGDAESHWLAAARALGTILTDERCKDHLLRDENACCIPPATMLVDRHPPTSRGGLDAVGDVLHALGSGLDALGGISESPVALELAASAHRSALEVRTRERVPLDWAGTQNNLGTVLWRLGEREEGTARLEEAAAAYRSALEVRTRERVPLDWAATQNNLGTVLWRLGGREEGTARLKEAAAAYRSALEVYTRERVPLNWALTQNNLGTALRSLGEREAGTARLEEAAAAYRSALSVWEKSMPHWAARVRQRIAEVQALIAARRGGPPPK